MFGGSVPESAEKDIARIREEIYGYKFGRGSVAAEDMKRILAEIRKLKT
jgi:triosephosphate isomerase